MGAGKTTIGKLLAKHLGKTFYDTDHEIEKRTGVKVSTIFELEGEAGFRKREAAIIQELSQLNNIIMATGGGAILTEENRQLLKSNGTVIYLVDFSSRAVTCRNDELSFIQSVRTPPLKRLCLMTVIIPRLMSGLTIPRIYQKEKS